MDGFEDDSDVGFIYKTMLTRDPKKRQVKPVAHHMLTLDFGGLDDSEDDDDYTLPQGKKGSSNDEGDSNTEDSNEDDEDDENEDDEEEEDDDDNNGDNESNIARSESGVADNDGESISVSHLSDDTSIMEAGESWLEKSGNIMLSENTVDTVLSTDSRTRKTMKLLICSVCLQDYSEGDDEIISCDGCGVAVHEGCYGMADSQSVASTVSSASTEPWFCDSCKAGIQPHCELCPNSGGIYKETDAGKWVHLVCALYIPGVAFGDIDKLSPVTLFEMPYTKWGAKECTLCDDIRFSRTGVCICCDAGMCRNYFHVTCAQREGLLSEASPDVEIADPFYAHCKQHADKLMMKIKRRNWLAEQSQEKRVCDQEQTDDVEQERIKRKLERHRRKYLEEKSNRPPCWVPQEKMPRMLTTSASALRKLMRKAELLGINTQNQNVVLQTDVSKKWHLATAFSVEFVSYYHDRNERILKMRTHQKELIAINEKLQMQEKLYRAKYEKMSGMATTCKNMKRKYEKLLNEGNQLWSHVSALSRKKLKTPRFLKPAKATPSPSKENVQVKPLIIEECGICSSNNDQHLLAKCDMCKLFYHLGCLKPPLTRMPKKTKLYGWQCSECVSSSSSDSDVSVDTSAPMRLRENIKEPVKFTLEQAAENQKKAEGKKKKKKKKKPAKKSNVATASCGEDDLPLSEIVKSQVVKKSRPPSKPKKEVDIRTECVQCGRPGDNSTLVRCDSCRDCYHLHCLDPPTKYTPKQRGYSWECIKCTPVESDSEDEEVAVDKEESKQQKQEVDDEVKNILTEEEDLMMNETAEENVDDNYQVFRIDDDEDGDDEVIENYEDC